MKLLGNDYFLHCFYVAFLGIQAHLHIYKGYIPKMIMNNKNCK
jgi:hypothetical protein